jgi:hypothetical protein
MTARAELLGMIWLYAAEHLIPNSKVILAKVK